MLGAGPPAPLLHGPRPNPPDTCCLPCLCGVRRLCLLCPLLTLQLSPWSPPPRDPPPAPRPSAPLADASEGPGGRWQHLVAERSLAAGLCRAPVTGWPGSPLPTQPGLGTPSSAAASAGQGVQRGSLGWARCLCHEGACMMLGQQDRQPGRAGVRPRAQPWQESSPNICFQLRAAGMVFLGRGRLLLHCWGTSGTPSPQGPPAAPSEWV